MRDQFVVSFQDLRFVTLFCHHCKTRVTLDLNAEFEPHISGRARFISPRECPRCNNSFDSAVPGAVDAMQKIYKALAPLKDAVTFTGSETSAES